MKKRSHFILDYPLRDPSLNGSGSNPSSTTLDSEPPHQGPDLEDLILFECGASSDPACAWEARGKSEDELMPEIEKHFLERHNRELDDSERIQVRRFCQNQRAA